jgi:hypothetical protein
MLESRHPRMFVREVLELEALRGKRVAPDNVRLLVVRVVHHEAIAAVVLVLHC